jgi:flagellar biosynthesis protein FlhA
VSRVGKGEHTGSQLFSQLFRQPQALIIAAAVLGILGMVPGMPHFAFILLATGMVLMSRWLLRRAQAAKVTLLPPAVSAIDALEVSWDDLVPVDAMGLEVGYRLIPLVDKGQDGELLRRIKAIRKKFAQDIGFLPPPVHIRDNLELAPNAYRILVKGVVVGEGQCHVGMYLAINPGRVSGAIQGMATTDPAFGLPAQWIEAGRREAAQAMGYTVVDAGTVVATHLSTVVHTQASALLGRQEVQSLLDQMVKASPKLVEEITPKLVPLATVQRVLQNLLDEGVNIRDLRTILETLADHAARTQDPNELTGAIRVALGRSIVQQIYGTTHDISVIGLDPELERVLQQVLGLAGTEGAGIEPDLAESLSREVAEAVRQQEALGQPTVLLVPDRLRWPLARLLRRGTASLRVLAHSEIPDARTIRVSTLVGGKR